MGDFYAIPISMAFLLAVLYALCVVSHTALADRLHILFRGMGHHNVMFMVLIFLLAGVFASLAKSIGAVDATVALCLSVMPASFLLPSLFLASCVISMSVGTSVGTIVALAPVACGMAQQTAGSVPLFTACIVGGAFFGDNLSFISDTTIVATRSQGIAMAEKFKANVRLVMPAALVSLVLYAVVGHHIDLQPLASTPRLWLVVPYITVLLLALFGVNVVAVLAIGIALCVSMAFMLHHTAVELFATMSNGVSSMSELIVVTMLAGGLMSLVRHAGGLDMLMQLFRRRVKSRRGAELCIGGLVLTADFCTANNTIAILTVSDLARDLSAEYGIPPRRTASLLDTWSCFAQALLPYGAQLLIAGGLVGLAPMEIVPFLFYPFILAFVVLASSFLVKETSK